MTARLLAACSAVAFGCVAGSSPVAAESPASTAALSATVVRSSSEEAETPVTRQPRGVPTLTLRPRSDTGSSASDRITRDATPTVSGTAKPRAKVAVLDGRRVVGTTTASKLGAWTLTLPRLLDGKHKLSARVGKTSSESTVILVDTVPPKVPSLATGDGVYTPTPTVLGRTEAGAIVSVHEGSTLIGSTEAQQNGRWSFTAPPLVPGTYWFTAFATDVAGNSSGASAAVEVITDASAASPVTIDLPAASDTSRSDDDVTRDPQPAFIGTASPSTVVTVRDNDTVRATPRARADGVWRIGSLALPVGVHRLTASAAGRTSEVLEVTIEPAPTVLDLSDLAAVGARRFDGAAAEGNAGASVDAAGDADGDGHEDILIATRRRSGVDDRGVVHLVFGSAADWPTTLDLRSLGDRGVTILATGPGVERPVAGLGDVNADGIDDVAVADGSRLYVLFGRGDFPATVDLAAFDAANGAVLEFGETVFSAAAAGDVNDDGIDDLIVDAGGAAAVVFGRVDLGSRESWETLDGSDGFRFVGAQTFESFGTRRVAGLGDVNGDGIADVAVGADGHVRRGEDEEDITGAIHVVYGRGSAFPATFDADADPSSYGFRILGWFEMVIGGWIVGGDVDGDGLGDILTSPGAVDPTSAPRLIYGRADGYGGTLDLHGAPPDAVLHLRGALTASSMRDLDGDRLADMVLSSPSGPQGGSAMVLYGRDIRRSGVVDPQTLVGLDALAIQSADPAGEFSASVAPMPAESGPAALLVGAPNADPLGRDLAGSAYVVPIPGAE